jgi:hypothetical protein
MNRLQIHRGCAEIETPGQAHNLPGVETLFMAARGTEASLQQCCALGQVRYLAKSVPRFPPGQESQCAHAAAASQNAHNAGRATQRTTQIQALSTPDNLVHVRPLQEIGLGAVHSLKDQGPIRLRIGGNAEYPPCLIAQDDLSHATALDHGEKGFVYLRVQNVWKLNRFWKSYTTRKAPIFHLHRW